MTMFSTPEIVACPHCQQRFTRQILCSFNNKWQVIYSDGGTTYDLEFAMFNETRCTHCQQIILDVQNIPSLGLLPKVYFWKCWFSKPAEYQHLSKPTSDVYLELFDKCSAEQKMQYALKAYRKFNQTYNLEDKTVKPNQTAIAQYQATADYILATPSKNGLPEYDLLCADIYRLRGQFDQALDWYAKVGEERLQYLVEQGLAWTKKQNTRLMVIRSKEQHNADKFGPIASADNKVFCNIDSQIHCPNHWNNLTRVPESLKQRRCEKCKQHVYHISSQRAFKHHTAKKHCIAGNINQLEFENCFSRHFAPEEFLTDDDLARYRLDGVG